MATIEHTHEEANENDTPSPSPVRFQTYEESLESTTQEEENGNPVELKRSTKKVLLEFRCRLEDAILGNYLFGKSFVRTGSSARERENLREISLWGVPLLPSKGHEGTDFILLKFLKARDFKVSEAFEMLRRTLIWRRNYKADEILDEKLCSGLENAMYINSTDRNGHPLCYNIFGAYNDRELYKKTFGTEEKCGEFLRWKVQFMEKSIKELSFKNGGVNSIVQIIDLKNSPGPGMKELRLVSKKALILLQDNYPELIHRNIIINVPFWYYACHTVLSRLITQRNKSRYVFARPSRVTETLLKFITPENLPIQYGGLKRANEADFLPGDNASEVFVKGGTTQSIKIPVSEAGVTVVWDVTTVGWEVTYKEEFIPDDEGSYSILLQKEKKMGESVRNSFYISEPGEIVITIDNATYKKKRVLYRYKIKPTVPMYVFLK